MTKAIQVTILGCRGSMPVCGDSYRHYGGATRAQMVQVMIRFMDLMQK